MRVHVRRIYWVWLLLAAIICISLNIFQDEEKQRLHEHTLRTFINVTGWKETPTVGCGGNFLGYGEEFVRLRFARISAKSKKFSIPCDENRVPNYTFQHGFEGTPLQFWLDNVRTYPSRIVPSMKLESKTTIAVMRIEAHNLYHTMCEWYNVFILSKLLNFDASKANILFLDDRPPGHMDKTWNTLFEKTIKYQEVDYNSSFLDLVWNIIGYESPMNFHVVRSIPFLDEFRSFFLSSHQVADNRHLDCTQLTVTVLLRRDYMTHPERKNTTGGLVHRKFKNEAEILKEINKVFADARVNILILEELSMNEQLNIISNTDVLIGMHGAGMTHILFLPKHAVVFEMFPRYISFYRHFKAMARWRKVKYFGWQNRVPENEFPDFFTRIPPAIVRVHCLYMKNYLCGQW